MTKNILHDFFLGFDSPHLASKLAFHSDFPKWNKRSDENEVFLELAVPGYSLEDLEVATQSSFIVISGNKIGSEADKYDYKGFSTKKFSKAFEIGDRLKVTNVSLELGILTITFARTPLFKDKEVLKISEK